MQTTYKKSWEDLSLYYQYINDIDKYPQFIELKEYLWTQLRAMQAG